MFQYLKRERAVTIQNEFAFVKVVVSPIMKIFFFLFKHVKLHHYIRTKRSKTYIKVTFLHCTLISESLRVIQIFRRLQNYQNYIHYLENISIQYTM